MLKYRSGVDCDYYEGFHPHYFVFCGYIFKRNVACYKGPWVPVISVCLFLEYRLLEFYSPEFLNSGE